MWETSLFKHCAKLLLGFYSTQTVKAEKYRVGRNEENKQRLLLAVTYGAWLWFRDILTKPSSFSMIAQPLQPHCRLSPHKCLHLLMPAITLPLCLASCTPSPAGIAVCTPPAGPLLMGPDHTQCLLAATMSKMRQPLQQCPCVFPAKPLSLASSAVYRLRGRLGGSMWLHWSQGPCSCLQAQPLSQLTPLLQLVTSPSICVPACPPTSSLTPVSTALCTHRHRMCSHRRALWQPRPWQLQVSL